MSQGCRSTDGSLINFSCKYSSLLNSVQIDRIYPIPLITETSPWRSHTNKFILNKSLASIMITISEKANANSSKALDIVLARGDRLIKKVSLLVIERYPDAASLLCVRIHHDPFVDRHGYSHSIPLKKPMRSAK